MTALGNRISSVNTNMQGQMDNLAANYQGRHHCASPVIGFVQCKGFMFNLNAQDTVDRVTSILLVYVSLFR